MNSGIEVTIDGHVQIIRLNRPDVLNSFNRTMALTLQAEIDKARQSSSIRAVLITGNGKAFCAGQDLSEAIDASGPGIENIVVEHYNPIITRLRHIEKPVVCAVNGVAAGAGANIALACDIVIASIPYVDTNRALMAPASLKSMVEQNGFTSVCFDLNSEIHSKILRHHQREKFLDFFSI
jgi:enoyl-CoA hydratase/carnithine racemase